MSALKWIVKEAKAIKKKYPKRFSKWTDYVAQASAIYASKHKGKSPVGKKKTAKKKAVKRKVAKKRIGAAYEGIGKIVRKKAARKKVVRKTATKKAYTHKDTKSHNVKISVMSGIGGYSKTQSGAIVRVFMKHKLRKAGFNVPSEISSNDLSKMYKHVTGKNAPTITKVNKLLKKHLQNVSLVYKDLGL